MVELEGYVTEVKDGGFQNQYINERGKKREDGMQPRHIPCRREIGNHISCSVFHASTNSHMDSNIIPVSVYIYIRNFLRRLTDISCLKTKPNGCYRAELYLLSPFYSTLPLPTPVTLLKMR